MDINADFDIGSAKAFGFKTWGTDIRYDVEARHLECFGKAAKLEPEDGRLRSRVLADPVALEIFPRYGAFVMSGLFTPKDTAPALQTFSEGGRAKLRAVTVQELESVWLTPESREGIAR